MFGEFAHAMPMDASAPGDAAVATTAQQPACLDHMGARAPVNQPEESAGKAGNAHHGPAHDGAAHDMDCCESGSCECPCLHISAVAASSLTVNLMLLSQTRLPVFADGLMQERLYLLLRPPA